MFDYLVPLEEEAQIIRQHGFELTYKDGKITDMLGRGSFATVYKAKRLKDNVSVACKVLSLHDDLLEWKRSTSKEKEFLNELNILKKLKHRHVITYYDNFILNNYSYSFMELSVGTLEEMSDNRQLLSEWECSAYFVQIVLAMGYLHRSGIAHRDLKLSNILIGSEKFANKISIVKVSDFGTCKMSFFGGKVTSDLSAHGTPLYMSPQMLKIFISKINLEPSRKKLGKIQPVEPFSADLWSLGVSLYYIFTKNYPYEIGVSFEEQVNTLQQQSQRQYNAFKRNVPVQLKDLIDSLLEFEYFARITIHGVERHPWIDIWEDKIENNLRCILIE